MPLPLPTHWNFLSGSKSTTSTTLMQVPSYSQPLAAINFGKMLQQYNNP
ncbi:hypothetical protein [Phormidesmis sp. 146-33]